MAPGSGLLLTALVVLALFLAGCHGVDLEPEETEPAEETSAEARPDCVPHYIDWPVEGGLHVACAPDHPPRLPDPVTSSDGPRIVFDRPQGSFGIHGRPTQSHTFHAVDTGVLPLRASFVNTANRTLHVDADQGCMRIRAWLDVDGKMVELTDFSRRWTCPDVSVGTELPPAEAAYPMIDQTFAIEPARLPAMVAGRTYTLYAAFDAETTTWNATGAANIIVVEGDALPRIQIEIHDTDLLNLTATFRNASNLTLEYTTSNSCDLWSITLLREDETIARSALPPGPQACFAATTRQGIAPGEDRLITYLHPESLPAGQYTVVIDVGSHPTWDPSGRATFTVE